MSLEGKLCRKKRKKFTNETKVRFPYEFNDRYFYPFSSLNHVYHVGHLIKIIPKVLFHLHTAR